MQYFTPELYLRFNSTDDQVADQAQHDWDVAIAAYQAHLHALRNQLPPQVRELSEHNFHDAGLLKYEVDPSGSALPAIAFLMLQEQKQLTALVYLLADEPELSAAPVDWTISGESLYWLYDEIDVRTEGGFIQRILLSSGRALIIPFHNAFLHEVPQTQLAYRQTA